MLLRGYPIQSVLFLIPVVLVSITIHELAHGFISYKLGDPTPRYQGRLTLNPLKHLDPLGALMFLLVGFGWAKPVQINPAYYKNRKKGLVLVSLAGPLSNILVAFIFSIPMYMIAVKTSNNPAVVFKASYTLYMAGFGIRSLIFNLCRNFYTINIIFAIFNLIPVPPLDGSKILSVILPQKYYYKIYQYEQVLVILLMVLIFVFPNIIFTIMSPFIWFTETAIKFITENLVSIMPV